MYVVLLIVIVPFVISAGFLPPQPVPEFMGQIEAEITNGTINN
jgi:hypothetical protein